MNTPSGLRFLRPYLCKDLRVSKNQAYVRLFNTTRCQGRESQPQSRGKENDALGVYKKPIIHRVELLKELDALRWPRIKSGPTTISISDFCTKYKDLEPGGRGKESVIVRGRLVNIRKAGKGLIFLDIEDSGRIVQAICNVTHLSLGTVTKADFAKFTKTISRGDFLSAFGQPFRSPSDQHGKLSVKCSELPIVISPALSSPPLKIEDPEARIRNRHLDLLASPLTLHTLQARSHIIQHIRNFFLEDQFLEVQTPIISDVAGGAIARPFTTFATEFSEKELALRIAPEIWLKRLVIGGMHRVFEIGPAFRNEGLDATHNPEFTSCEFYKAYADLDDLMLMTEQMISGIAHLITDLRTKSLHSLPELDMSHYDKPFRRVSFIPEIERHLEQKLPDLNEDSAREKILAIFNDKSLPLPSSTTLPRLLDKLAGLYIEQSCNEPTFVIHPPACLAPLAKSFLDSHTNQLVSARAELFMKTREVANMYEEENSPFEQRAKFKQQLKYKDDENNTLVDESYLEALEYGLPPTGGWGCGIDRLVMLFTGANRIADVLSFGSLKNVVNLSKPAPRTGSSGLADFKDEAQTEKKQAKQVKLEEKKADASIL